MSRVEVNGVGFSGSHVPEAGLVYSRLIDWDGRPAARGGGDSVPGGQGVFPRSEELRDSRAISVEAAIVADSTDEYFAVKRRVESMPMFGEMRVDQGDGYWTRQVEVEQINIPDAFTMTETPFTIDLIAPDPVRYTDRLAFGPLGVPQRGRPGVPPVVLETNHAPSLFGPTSTVTVRRNLVPSPVAFSAGLELSRCTIAATGGVCTGTVNAVGFFPRVITAQPVRNQFPVTPGEQMTGSMRMHTNGVTYNMRMQWFSSPTVSAGTTPQVPQVGVAGQYFEITATVPAGAVYGVLEIGVADNTPVSTQFAYSEPQFVVGPQRLPFWAVGIPSPYAGLTPAWAGTAESSPTLLRGEHPTAFTDADCISTVYDEDGKRWLRITATNPASASSYTRFTIPSGALRTAGTVLGRVKVLSAQGGTPHPSARGIRVLSPEFKAQAANVPGETDLRLPYTNLTGTYEVGLFHGLNLGSADVSWTDIGLYEGDYLGPVFGIDTPEETTPEGVISYRWADAVGGPVEKIFTVPELGAGLRLPERFPWNFGIVTRPTATVVNVGSVPVYPVVTVQGSADAITIHGGPRRIEFGSFDGTLVIDNRNRRAFLNGVDVTRHLVRRDWQAIPPGASWDFFFEATNPDPATVMSGDYQIGAW